MSKPWPKVSVIVPVYNGEKTIEKCLESLTHQDYPGIYEVILVNNKSTDNTIALARRYIIRIVDALDFQSSYYARNIGLTCCKSEIVAFTDSDCVADRKWIQYLVQYLLQNPKVKGVGGNIVHLERNKLETIFGSNLGIRNKIDGSNSYLVTANAAYWLETIREVNCFDPTCFSGGDVDLSWKILQKGYQVALEPQAVVYHFPRETVISFLKQSYKYGMGHARLLFGHQVSREYSSASSIKSESLLIAGFLVDVAKGVVNRNRNQAKEELGQENKKLTIITQFFRVVSISVFVLGIIRGFKVDSSEKRHLFKASE